MTGAKALKDIESRIADTTAKLGRARGEVGKIIFGQDDIVNRIFITLLAFRLKGRRAELHDQALEWAKTRGAHSGRVAWQFVQDTAGKQKRTLAA